MTAPAFGSVVVIGAAIALAIVDNPVQVAVLDVRASRELDVGDGCGPSSILILVEERDFLVGEELRRPLRTSNLATLRGRLRALKDERPERAHVVVQASDLVDCERLVGVVDAARSVELFTVDVLVTPAGPMFTEDEWGRPGYRPLLPTPGD